MMGMKRYLMAAAFAGLMAAPATLANEHDMQRVLSLWDQQMVEYEAALSMAHSDEQRELITPPSADELAPNLWKTVRKQTGTRPVAASGTTTGKQANGRSAQSPAQQVPTYEFEEPWAAPAVIWFINHPDAFARIFSSKPEQVTHFALALMNSVYRVHYSNPLIAKACPTLAAGSSADTYKILEKIYEQNQDPTTRANAALALSIILSNPTMGTTEGGQAHNRAKRVFYLRQALNLAPDDAMFGSQSLTEAAQEQIYQLGHLAHGTIPPRFQVTGPDGKPAVFPVIGRANLLFFWSPGEDIGLSIMSKQRLLMEKYPQLVLCPIVPHGDAEMLQNILQENGISICYMDDDKGSVGTAYRVRQLPLAVLLSERATILYIGYPDMQLQTALDTYFNKTPNRTPANTAPANTAPALRPIPEI